jgi:hypothetical protein
LGWLEFATMSDLVNIVNKKDMNKVRKAFEKNTPMLIFMNKNGDNTVIPLL